MKLNGYLSLNPVTSTNGNYLEVSVEDRASGVRFVQAKIELKDAHLLLSNRMVPVALDVRGLNVIGKKKETQEATLLLPRDFRGRDQDQVLSDTINVWLELENYSWQVHESDRKWNSHKAKYKDQCIEYTITVYRYVEVSNVL